MATREAWYIYVIICIITFWGIFKEDYMSKILVTCDDYWHPGEVVERGLSFLSDEYELDFVKDAKDILTPSMLADYSLIINAKMDEINASNQTPWFDDIAELKVCDIAEYIKKGNGFLSLHAGNSYFWDKNREYCELNGCAFVTHPPRCTISVEKTDVSHPITEGIETFEIRDEHYEVDHVIPEAQIILKSTSSAGGTQVAGYVHTLGDGRMCSLMPGHILSVFENKEYQKVIRNAIKWCIKEI